MIDQQTVSSDRLCIASGRNRRVAFTGRGAPFSRRLEPHGLLINAKYQTPIIRNVSPAKLIVECQGKHLACSYAEVGSPCLIFLPLVGWQPMLRHEMGHCRGWSADHKS